MTLIEEIENLIRPVLLQNQFELFEVQYRKEAGRWILRLFIDKVKADGPVSETEANALGSKITLDDCESVSEWIGPVLDSSDLLAHSYILEVSSPGINRPLKNESHYLSSIGQKVKVSLYAPLLKGGKQKNFCGVLLDCKGHAISVEDEFSGIVQIPLSSIARAHLDII